MLLYALYLHFIIRIYPLLCSSSRTIMYFVEVRYGLYDLERSNELVAEAFATLPQMEQSILILHCTLDLADGEIGNLVEMSRSAVQRHRTRALQELREALSALMPKGG